MLDLRIARAVSLVAWQWRNGTVPPDLKTHTNCFRASTCPPPGGGTSHRCRRFGFLFLTRVTDYINTALASLDG